MLTQILSALESNCWTKWHACHFIQLFCCRVRSPQGQILWRIAHAWDNEMNSCNMWMKWAPETEQAKPKINQPHSKENDENVNCVSQQIYSVLVAVWFVLGLIKRRFKVFTYRERILSKYPPCKLIVLTMALTRSPPARFLYVEALKHPRSFHDNYCL